MATKTTYTSTIRVPIYASWKCHCCGEINFSQGNISCQRQVTTSSLRKSKQEEAENEASNLVYSEWQQNALNVIFNAKKDPQNMRSSLFFQNTNCTKCGKKPMWDKGTGNAKIFSLSFGPAIISGIAAIAMLTNWIAWLIFVMFLGIIAYCFAIEYVNNKKIKNLSNEYLPVIGSLNEELISAAEIQGKKLPSPDETIQIVENISNAAKINTQFDSIEQKRDNTEIKIATSDNDKEQVRFCRKCGAKLPEGSEFCNKCGVEVIR